MSFKAPALAQAPAPAGVPTKAGPPQQLPANVLEEPPTVGEGEWAVHGLLDRPAGVGRAPAIALLHGSGPGTRDLDVDPNKIFREIAWGLAARGVVVARYDKRTTAHAKELRAAGRATTIDDEFTDDAVSARDSCSRAPTWIRSASTSSARARARSSRRS